MECTYLIISLLDNWLISDQYEKKLTKKNTAMLHNMRKHNTVDRNLSPKPEAMHHLAKTDTDKLARGT